MSIRIPLSSIEISTKKIELIVVPQLTHSVLFHYEHLGSIFVFVWPFLLSYIQRYTRYEVWA